MNSILIEIYKNLNKDVEWIKDRVVFATVYGSRAYGLNTPESDFDIRGICVPPKEYFLGFNKNFNELTVENPDCVIFNIKKFFNLTSQGNPNCLEVLFTEPEDHLFISSIGQILLDNRDKFLSKLLKERYLGYSKAQAYRIKNHRKFLLNPLTHKPTRAEYNLPEKPLIDKDQFDCIKSLINKKLASWIPDFEPFSESQKIYLQGKVSEILVEMEITKDDNWASAARTIGLDDNLIEIIKKEKEFENKLEEWKNYNDWKKNRNPKRAALESKFGFDLKHACQLVRLLHVGKEILETGKVKVKRTYDKDQLMSIKRGAWTYDQLIDYIEKIEPELKIAYNNSKLPNQPDIKFLDRLCIELIEKINEI